jgi:hypothetical protein
MVCTVMSPEELVRHHAQTYSRTDGGIRIVLNPGYI